MVGASYWRDKAKPIVAKVLKETQGQDESIVRRALRDAYPFGPRNCWPYKVWLDEIKNQRGLKKPKPIKTDPRQISLLEGSDG
jgi:hypothetical protein